MSARRSHLRLLALSIEEQGAGKFVWCLRESTGDAVVFEPVQRAASAYPSYSAAMAAGYAEWQRMVSADPDNGLRVTAGPLMPPGKLSRRKLSVAVPPSPSNILTPKSK